MFRTAFNRLTVRTLSTSAVRSGLGLKSILQGTLKATVMPHTSMIKSSGFVGRQMHNIQSKADEELVTFLKEEIPTETKASHPLGTKLDDFQVSFEESVLTFKKKFNDESIVITLNVNLTVDAEPVDESTQPTGAAEQEGEMKSRPNFDVDIVKGDQTLTFSCSYAVDDGEHPGEGQEDYIFPGDLFVIDEVSMYSGEPTESTYAVAGEILDGYLYDLFMNMLEERGVNNEFVEKVSDYATNYEHSLYVKLLTKLQSFVKTK